MSEIQQSELSPDDKKLFNILEIKIYDISQNVEILNRQLMPNQIKEIVAHSFSIFNQLKYFFEKSKVLYLYNVIRKMQINTVLMTSLLTDKLQKQSKEPVTTSVIGPRDNSKQNNEEIFENEIELKQKSLCKKIRQLGGIYLYNQHYTRGLEYQNFKQILPSSEVNGNRVKMVKRNREDFLNTIMKQIDNKAEVQVEGISEQIKNYITNYKQNTKVANFISCEKELGEIIDFFKLSELQALNFLNKSPNHNDYTEDYINRLNEMERDIKVKQKSEKIEIHQKMKLFIQKLKEKMAQIQKEYQEKNAKLVQYQKSLKKETVTEGTQTYDNFERRIKDLQNKLKEEQQRYNILNEMRKAEHSLEDQMHHLKNQIQVKNNNLKKLEQANLQLEEELEYLKKVIRDNKQKLSVVNDPQKRKMKSKQKNLKDLTAKKIEDVGVDQKSQPKVEQDQMKHRRETRSSQLKEFKKTRKYDKLGTYSGYRSSFEVDNLSELDKKTTQDIKASFATEQLRPSIAIEQKQKISENKLSAVQKTKNFQKNVQKNQIVVVSAQLSPVISSKEIKQSIFKQQHKKNTLPRKGEEQSKVSFKMPQNNSPLIEEVPESSNVTPKRIDSDIIRQRSLQQSLQKSRTSIQGYQKSEQILTRRSQRKNTLKQKLDRSICSIKSIKDLDQGDSRKESKSVSKKCIILKDKKEKNIIATSIKLTNMTIVHQFDLLIQEQIPKNKKQSSIYEQMRLERPSAPISLARGINHTEQNIKNSLVRSKKKIGMVQFKKKQKVNSKDAGNLQPLKYNKSVGSIVLSHKLGNKQDQSTTFVREISKEKRISINNTASVLSLLQKRQLNSQDKTYIASLLQKIDGQKISQEQEQQRIHSNLCINKENKSSTKKMLPMDYLRNDLSKAIEKWSYEDSTYLQNGISNYIMEELQAQDLNISELKEIMTTIDAYQDSAMHKKIQGEQKHKIQQQSKKNQVKINSNNRKSLSKMFILDGVSLLRLKEIHQKYTNCAAMNKENKLCQHLQKYVSIVQNISELRLKYKLPLKLPIQRIGQIDRPSQKESKYYRTVDQVGQNYLKSHTVTDHNYDEQKPRILPIINNTTSGYYKPKSKIVR